MPLFEPLKLTRWRLYPKTEALVFFLIARQYLMQCYRDYDYLSSQIKLEIEGGLFKAIGNTLISLVCKSLLLNQHNSKDADNEKQSEVLK